MLNFHCFQMVILPSIKPWEKSEHPIFLVSGYTQTESSGYFIQTLAGPVVTPIGFWKEYF